MIVTKQIQGRVFQREKECGMFFKENVHLHTGKGDPLICTLFNFTSTSQIPSCVGSNDNKYFPPPFPLIAGFFGAVPKKLLETTKPKTTRETETTKRKKAQKRIDESSMFQSIIKMTGRCLNVVCSHSSPSGAPRGG